MTAKTATLINVSEKCSSFFNTKKTNKITGIHPPTGIRSSFWIGGTIACFQNKYSCEFLGQFESVYNFRGYLTIYTGKLRHKEPCYNEPFRTMNVLRTHVLRTHVLCTPDSVGSSKANLVIMNLQYNEQFEMLPKRLVYRSLPVARPHVLLYVCRYMSLQQTFREYEKRSLCGRIVIEKVHMTGRDSSRRTPNRLLCERFVMVGFVTSKNTCNHTLKSLLLIKGINSHY